MAVRRDAICPLCGAGLTATELLDAGTELIEPRLGVVETHCPHCQGYLEVMPAQGRVDVGYLVGPDKEAFEVARSLDLEGLTVERGGASQSLKLTANGASWEFFGQALFG